MTSGTFGGCAGRGRRTDHGDADLAEVYAVKPVLSPADSALCTVRASFSVRRWLLILTSTATSSANSSTATRRRVFPAMSRGRTEASIALACNGVMSFLACPGSSSASNACSRSTVGPTPRQCFAAVREDPRRLQLAIDFQDPQSLGPDGDHRDRVGVQGVALAVVAGVEQPSPGRQVGRLRCELVEELGPPPLPQPGSAELAELVTDSVAHEIYALLYRRRANAPTMHEVETYIADKTGEAHTHVNRRLRSLRESGIDVPAQLVGGEHRYRLLGWRPTGPRYGRPNISAKVSCAGAGPSAVRPMR